MHLVVNLKECAEHSREQREERNEDRNRNAKGEGSACKLRNEKGQEECTAKRDQSNECAQHKEAPERHGTIFCTTQLSDRDRIESKIRENAKDLEVAPDGLVVSNQTLIQSDRDKLNTEDPKHHREALGGELPERGGCNVTGMHRARV